VGKYQTSDCEVGVFVQENIVYIRCISYVWPNDIEYWKHVIDYRENKYVIGKTIKTSPQNASRFIRHNKTGKNSALSFSNGEAKFAHSHTSDFGRNWS
jgi:hypothetical protein